MTKLERTMETLRRDHEQTRPAKADPKPQPTETGPTETKPQPQPKYAATGDLRTRLAYALMRAENQIKCRNCRYRWEPCRRTEECKKDGAFLHFSPCPSLGGLQLKRADCVIEEIKRIL